ncbi:MAG TPA: hydantoinase/oxoprolinase family protein [Baekduia sp.]|nr:hydantoinase/oxoprolinase family protein [Baekduia sp.]
MSTCDLEIAGNKLAHGHLETVNREDSVPTRIGVDIGGTFTDLMFYDADTGEVRVGKQPTTPAAPEEGVCHAVAAAVPEELVRAAAYFIHGTTTGLNAVIQRNGARVGLIATSGFRDVLEIRRADRAHQFDPRWRPSDPLVPRHLRIGVRERIRGDGTIEQPLVIDDVVAALGQFVEHEVECIAVALMNAYRNPAHELAVEQAVRGAGFAGELSLSHRASGEYREYERTSTTVVDAYVRPKMQSYLRRLDSRLRDLGLQAPLLINRSGGGAMSLDETVDRSFETIMSGPAGGAEGAAELARTLGLDQVITADVGGTSFDTTVIVDGRPTVLFEGDADGMPIQVPWVDVRSIGAGGGSIAWVDQGGLLQVGPRSAGADPGPATYRRGGTQPTVTDAACWLGMLGDGALAAGIHLDREDARMVLEPLGEGVGLSVDDVARGIMTVAAASMANAIREITIERGRDPRHAALLPFGGAGGMFAVLVAQDLGLQDIVVPPFAGNFSAWGMLGADAVSTRARTILVELAASGVQRAEAALAELFASMRGTGSAHAEHASQEAELDLRYSGQEHSITISAPLEGGRLVDAPEVLSERFAAMYEQTFSVTMEQPVEIVAVRATLRTSLPRGAAPRGHARPELATAADGLQAYSFLRQEWLRFAIVERATLVEGAELQGPAIVVEETSTLYLDTDCTAAVHPSGVLMVSRSERDR